LPSVPRSGTPVLHRIPVDGVAAVHVPLHHLHPHVLSVAEGHRVLLGAGLGKSVRSPRSRDSHHYRRCRIRNGASITSDPLSNVTFLLSRYYLLPPPPREFRRVTLLRCGCLDGSRWRQPTCQRRRRAWRLLSCPPQQLLRPWRPANYVHRLPPRSRRHPTTTATAAPHQAWLTRQCPAR